MADDTDSNPQTIRVIYRWRLSSDRWGDFAAWWHDETLRIRSAYPGALGSVLCNPSGDDEHLIGIARWKSEDDLVRFWADQPGDRGFSGAVLESAELLGEIDNLIENG